MRSSKAAASPPPSVTTLLGLDFVATPPRSGNSFEFPVVSSVSAGGAAARAGVLAGSSIVEVKKSRVFVLPR